MSTRHGYDPSKIAVDRHAPVFELCDLPSYLCRRTAVFTNWTRVFCTSTCVHGCIHKVGCEIAKIIDGSCWQRDCSQFKYLYRISTMSTTLSLCTWNSLKNSNGDRCQSNVRHVCTKSSQRIFPSGDGSANSKPKKNQFSLTCFSSSFLSVEAKPDIACRTIR